MFEIFSMLFGLVLYFAPSLMAIFREHSNQNSIFLTNLFFGWTLIGWVVAMIWSVSDNTK